MAFSSTSLVSVAVDPEVSVGQFANALSGAGLKMRFENGLLRVSRDELASIAVPSPTLHRETPRGLKARRSRSANAGASTRRKRS
jgi:hypothetical protein